MQIAAMSDFVTGMEICTRDGKPIVPLNSMFWGCTYVHFCWDFPKARVPEFHSKVINKILGHGEFYIDLAKISSDEFKVSLNRVHPVPSKIQDSGYFLEIIITVVGHKKHPIRKLMDHRIDSVYEVYQYADLDVRRRESKIWTIQCVVHMHEMSVLYNEATEMQNKLIKKLEMEEMYCKNFTDMAFLLKRESLNDIFSGRQDYEFALCKAGFIKRTLIFADEIAQKVKAKNIKLQTQTPSDVYLCYILKGDFKPISKREVLNLYTLALHFGLSYLVDECRYFMLQHLDAEFIVHVLEHAVATCDFKLIPEVMFVFSRNRQIVMQTATWETLLRKSFHTVRCIMHIAERRHAALAKLILAQNVEKYESQGGENVLDVSDHMEKLTLKVSSTEKSLSEEHGKQKSV